MASSSNNGFLCINTNKEALNYGEITDCDDNLVCPGIIMPKYNPEKDELVSYLHISKYYSQVLKGKELRLYKYNQGTPGSLGTSSMANSYIQVSSNEEIYPEKYLKMLETSTYEGQIDYDLIKDEYVYYFIITPTELVLTHIRLISNEGYMFNIEENIRLIDEDIAFIHHLPYNMFSDEVTMEDINILLEEYVSYENGINIYSLENYFQIWSNKYSLYKSYEKPDGVSIYKYYFMCLNKYYKDNIIEDDDELLLGEVTDNSSINWTSLLCDIDNFVKYYPEYSIEINKMTNGLKEYVGIDKYNNHFGLEKFEGMKKLDYLLGLDYNEALGLITPMPSRRGSFI